jgi:hypothetical protein
MTDRCEIFMPEADQIRILAKYTLKKLEQRAHKEIPGFADLDRAHQYVALQGLK